MKYFNINSAVVALSAVQAAYAHAGFSNFFVNGVDQGDAICVRMNPVPDTWSNPLEALTSTDMACGFQGTKGVDRVCAVPDGATLTFEWREVANDRSGGVIDISHMGPCAVYVKKVDSAINDQAAGDGWFKIWDEGYDESTQQWCTKKLIDDGGLLSVQLPQGLVGGYYLVRPELLALHEADKGDPQYYTGCAQIFLESSGNLVPSSTVSIPGYVSISDPGNSFNIYDQPMALPYPIPGPGVTTFTPSGTTTQTSQTEGQKPADCILEWGSNFCGVEVPTYNDENSCWASSQNCWDQATACYNNAPPTGDTGCRTWEAKCGSIQDACNAGQFHGPPDAGKDLTPPTSTIDPPPPFGPTVVGGSIVSPASGYQSTSPSSTPSHSAGDSLPPSGTDDSPESASGYPPTSPIPTPSHSAGDSLPPSGTDESPEQEDGYPPTSPIPTPSHSAGDSKRPSGDDREDGGHPGAHSTLTTSYVSKSSPIPSASTLPCPTEEEDGEHHSVSSAIPSASPSSHKHKHRKSEKKSQSKSESKHTTACKAPKTSGVVKAPKKSGVVKAPKISEAPKAPKTPKAIPSIYGLY